MLPTSQTKGSSSAGFKYLIMYHYKMVAINVNQKVFTGAVVVLLIIRLKIQKRSFFEKHLLY